MIQNAQRLVDRARRYIQDTAPAQQGQSFTDVEVLDLINEEQDELIAVMVEGSEDYFAVAADLAFQANVNAYPLFSGLLFLRKLRYTGGGSGSAPSDAIESRLIEGANDPGGIGTPDQSDYFYSVFGDSLNVQPTPTADLAAAMKGYFVRDPGPLFLEKPASVPDASNFVLSSSDVPRDSDILIGTNVHVVSGTGAGQVRQISVWNGTTKQATVTTPFSPTLDTTSLLASETRIVRLFHTLLSLGAGLRAKTILEEDLQKLQFLYGKQFEKFEDFVYRARTYAQRSIQPMDFEAY